MNNAEKHHFVVIGRAWGDDEDTCRIYALDSPSADQARLQFISDMCAEMGWTQEDLGHDEDVFINHTVYSTTKIKEIR